MTSAKKEKKATRKQLITEHLKLHYDECGDHYGAKNIWVTMLYGSQNYHLDTPASDFDTKTMLLPSIREVVLGKKMVSTDLQISDGGLSNVKDYRAMFQNYLKGNINFLETLFTNWVEINPNYCDLFKDLRRERNLIANCRPRKLVHMAAGMANQKYVAFDKPFESKKKVLEEYGYDPKQLLHLHQLYIFIKNYNLNSDFGNCLVLSSEVHRVLMDYELMPYDYSKAIEIREDLMKEINKQVEFADKALPEDNCYEEAVEFLDDLATRVFKRRFKEEVPSKFIIL